jgi:penicillin amidase
MNRTLIAPTIYWKWIELYQINTWKDEFVDWDAYGLKFPDVKILENLTKNDPNSIWFNLTTAAGTQDRNYTLLKALNDTVDWYIANYDADVSTWIWGNVHKIYFEHLSGLGSLSRGPYSHDGSSWTPNNAGGSWDDDEKAYIVQAGPSWRMVIDLGNSTTELISVGVYPGGQSGNPVSSHYDDLLNLWLNYEYHDIYFLTQNGVTEATILFTRS